MTLLKGKRGVSKSEDTLIVVTDGSLLSPYGLMVSTDILLTISFCDWFCRECGDKEMGSISRPGYGLWSPISITEEGTSRFLFFFLFFEDGVSGPLSDSHPKNQKKIWHTNENIEWTLKTTFSYCNKGNYYNKLYIKFICAYKIIKLVWSKITSFNIKKINVRYDNKTSLKGNVTSLPRELH